MWRAPGRGGEDVQKQGGGGRCREWLAKPDLGNRCDRTGPGVTSRAKGPLGTLVFLEGEKLRDPYFQKNALLEKNSSRGAPGRLSWRSVDSILGLWVRAPCWVWSLFKKKA